MSTEQTEHMFDVFGGVYLVPTSTEHTEHVFDVFGVV
jgi:hypothetical protein